jgi:hypothetical protein
MKVWTGFIWLKKGPLVVAYEYCVEFLGFVKGEGFIGQLNGCEFLQKDCVPRS